MPLDPNEFQRSVSTEERFNELRPKKKASRIDPQWEQDLTAIKEGQILEYEASDPGRANTLRRSLGRFAAARAIKLEFSGEGTTVLVRKSADALVPKSGRDAHAQPAGNGRRRRGRRQKQEAIGTDAADVSGTTQ